MGKFVADSVNTMTDENGDLIVCFKVNSDYQFPAKMAVQEIKGKEIEVDTKIYHRKRSLEQNRLLWALLEKMAIGMSGTKHKVETEDCYIYMLEETNAKCEFLLGLPETEESLKQYYRVVRAIGERKVGDKTLKMYQCYIGSSKFNTKEMTELIEAILDKLAEMGITDSEIEAARIEYA